MCSTRILLSLVVSLLAVRSAANLGLGGLRYLRPRLLDNPRQGILGLGLIRSDNLHLPRQHHRLGVDVGIPPSRLVHVVVIKFVSNIVLVVVLVLLLLVVASSIPSQTVGTAILSSYRSLSYCYDFYFKTTILLTHEISAPYEIRGGFALRAIVLAHEHADTSAMSVHTNVFGGQACFHSSISYYCNVSSVIA